MSPPHRSSAHVAAAALASLACLLALPAMAQEAVIRKNLSERLPNFPKIDEVTKLPHAPLWEVRIGNELLYTDEQGQYLIEGHVIETRTRANLTEARLDKLTAIDFASLPLKDAIVWKAGTGERKLVQFADPNCGYCKRFERELTQIKNVTVYTFLLPILGGDSPEKSRAIWCAKDPGETWRAWMIDGQAPPRVMGSKCDASALDRNVALARKHRINGTPALVFASGKRVPGALGAEQVERHLVAERGDK
jgi:thiol:disulfide interchange protein DsbC